MSMNVNLRQPERLIRAAIGTVVAGIGLMFSSWWGGIGMFLILTSLYGSCPMYAAAGALASAVRHRSKAHG